MIYQFIESITVQTWDVEQIITIIIIKLSGDWYANAHCKAMEVQVTVICTLTVVLTFNNPCGLDTKTSVMGLPLAIQ